MDQRVLLFPEQVHRSAWDRTLLDGGEDLIRLRVLEAAAGLVVLGKIHDACHVQGDAQRDVVDVQLSARWQARHVGDHLIHSLDNIWKALLQRRRSSECFIT